jgi:hypothetical protein
MAILRLANATVSAQADALARLLDNGYLRIYDGSQPATADTAIGAQVLLAELRFAATSCPAANNGVLTANAITSDASANATGTATWARLLKSDGSTVVQDCDVGTSGNTAIINSTAISSGAQVDCTSWTHTVPKT